MWNCTEGGDRLEKSGVLRPRSLEFDPSESFRSSCISRGDEGTPVGEAAPSEGMAAAPPLLLPPLRCICSKARFWEGTGTGSVRGPLGTLCLGGGTGSGCCCTGKYEGRGEPSWLPGGEAAPPEAIFLAGVLPESSLDQRGPPPAASPLGWSSPIEAGTMTKSCKKKVRTKTIRSPEAVPSHKSPTSRKECKFPNCCFQLEENVGTDDSLQAMFTKLV